MELEFDSARAEFEYDTFGIEIPGLKGSCPGFRRSIFLREHWNQSEKNLGILKKIRLLRT